MTNIKKLYINIGLIIALITTSFILFFSFSYGFDPKNIFITTSTIGLIFLLLIIFFTIKLKKKNNNSIYQVADWLAFFAISLLIITSTISYFFMPARVVGESMEDTLYNGDYVLTYHFNYTPKTNHVVAILVEENIDGDEVNYVKRIVGIPDDVLKIEAVEETAAIKKYKLFINDNLYDDNKTISIGEWKKMTGSDNSSYVIPEGKYMAFGDN